MAVSKGKVFGIMDNYWQATYKNEYKCEYFSKF